MRSGAVVLCGGESRRMGRPKAWLEFGKEVMLERVVRLVSTVAWPIVVVAAPGQDLPAASAGSFDRARRNLRTRAATRTGGRLRCVGEEAELVYRDGHGRAVPGAAVDHTPGGLDRRRGSGDPLDRRLSTTRWLHSIAGEVVLPAIEALLEPRPAELHSW